MLRSRNSKMSVRVNAVSVAMDPRLSMIVPMLSRSHWRSLRLDLRVGMDTVTPTTEALVAFAAVVDVDVAVEVAVAAVVVDADADVDAVATVVDAADPAELDAAILPVEAPTFALLPLDKPVVALEDIF